jgi:hypothetical protein
VVWHGVPFDVAFALSDVERTAYSIIFSEFEGQKFNWNRMQFDEPS